MVIGEIFKSLSQDLKAEMLPVLFSFYFLEVFQIFIKYLIFSQFLKYVYKVIRKFSSKTC